MNFAQEWDFIVTETHLEKPCGTNRLKREMLFVLQIILSKIQDTTPKQESNFLTKNYFALKSHL